MNFPDPMLAQHLSSPDPSTPPSKGLQVHRKDSFRKSPVAVVVLYAQGLREGLAPRGPNELFGLGEPRSPAFGLGEPRSPEPSCHAQSQVQQPASWSPIGSGGVGGQQQVGIMYHGYELTDHE